MKALIITTISLITIGFNMAQPKPMPVPVPEFTDELNNIICIEEGLR